MQQRIPHDLPAGVFPPAVHLCYQAAGLAVPVSLAPPTVAHVPLAQQNPIENLALQAEGALLHAVPCLLPQAACAPC